MTRTVYHRALEHYSMGNEEAALEGIQQGIEVLEAPELYLLAALIYRKRGEFKEMREHVAAIPADDVLRGEGEWLLRSHQEQLQLGRREEARKRGRVKGTQLAVGKASRQFSTEYYPAPLAEKRDSMIGALKVRRNRLPWAIPIAVVLLAVILLTQGAGDSLLSALRQLRSVPDELASVFSSLTRDEPTVDSEAASAPDHRRANRRRRGSRHARPYARAADRDPASRSSRGAVISSDAGTHTNKPAHDHGCIRRNA